MSVLSSGYSISRPTGVCAATGRAFAVGDRFVAALVERPDSPGFERQDFAIDAWDAGSRPAPPLAVFATWRAVLAPSDQKKKTIALNDEELLDLFEQLGGVEDPRRKAFRYMLALILVRRRVLRLEATRPGKLFVKPRGSTIGDPIEVEDPGTSEEVIAGAIEELGQIIDVDVAAAPGRPGAEAGPGASA